MSSLVTRDQKRIGSLIAEFYLGITKAQNAVQVNLMTLAVLYGFSFGSDAKEQFDDDE